MSATRKRLRWRITRDLPGWWSFGFARSTAPLPRPKGIVLYVVHFLFWNLVVEYDR